MRLRRRLVLGQLSASAFAVALFGRPARAETVTYVYDNLGRLVGATYQDGASITYQYDAAGNRTLVAQTPASAAPSGTFSANPGSIGQGGSSTLSWTSSNATSATIDNGVGSVTPVAGGSVNVSPTTTTTYTLTLTGPGGQTTLQATVTVSGGFSQTIQITGTGPINLRTLANNAGYNGAQNATITFQLGSAVTILGAAGASAANGGICIDTGTWPSASYAIALTLQISGKAYGGGGGGNGGAGGDAIYCRENIAITVNAGGQVKGGGGGGGRGGGWQHDFKDGEGFWDTEFLEGGGGGGGFPNGQSGASGGPGGSGSNGTTSGGGAGGSAGTVLNHTCGAGGAGGGAAAAGAAGANGSGSATCGSVHCWYGPGAGAPGGAAGYAIRKNGKTVTVTNNGTITGTQA